MEKRTRRTPLESPAYVARDNTAEERPPSAVGITCACVAGFAFLLALLARPAWVLFVLIGVVCAIAAVIAFRLNAEAWPLEKLPPLPNHRSCASDVGVGNLTLRGAIRVEWHDDHRAYYLYVSGTRLTIAEDVYRILKDVEYGMVEYTSYGSQVVRVTDPAGRVCYSSSW